jgi:hypothetical protein
MQQQRNPPLRKGERMTKNGKRGCTEVSGNMMLCYREQAGQNGGRPVRGYKQDRKIATVSGHFRVTRGSLGGANWRW